MSDVLAALGPDYSVSTQESPEQALKKAMEKVGVTDFRVLAQAGWGGPLHPFMHSPRIRDIWVQNATNTGNVFIRTRDGGKASKTATGIFMPAHWTNFLVDLWRNAYNETKQKVTLNPTEIFRSTLLFKGGKGGFRYLYQPPAFSAYGPGLYLRGLPPAPYPLEDLVDNETLPADAANLLSAFLQVGTPMIVCGQTGAGKTTVLAALIRELQKKQYPLNMLLIERSHEIPLENPCYRWEMDESGAMGLDHLAEKATQLGLEQLVIGECTGPEAYFAAKAFAQGVPMMTTLHADSSAAGFKRLAMLALEYVKDPRLLPIIMEELSTQGVISVHLSLKERDQGYLGTITGIDEMVGVSGNNPIINPLWEWRKAKENNPEGLYFNPGSLSGLSGATKTRFYAAGLEFPVPALNDPAGKKGKKR